LPWGSLLHAVALPEPDSLRHVARLCAPNAKAEIVFSYDEQDSREGAPLGSLILDEKHIAALPERYSSAGLQIISAECIPQQKLTAYNTTWAKRLAFGRTRKIWRIRAKRIGTSSHDP
jgi:hypothetical protein